MSDSFRDVGELGCVGRSGGYWGFAKIDFDDPITPDIAQILKNIDKHKLLEQVSFNNDSTLYSDEHDIAELIFNSISINDYAVINPTLASRLDEFVVRCKKLVDYYEDANNLLAEAEEDDYTFERIISTQDAIVDNDSNLLIISTINDHIIESVYNTTTKAVEYNYDDTVKSSIFINNIMQVVEHNVMEQIKHLTDIAKVIK